MRKDSRRWSCACDAEVEAAWLETSGEAGVRCDADEPRLHVPKGFASAARRAKAHSLTRTRTAAKRRVTIASSSHRSEWGATTVSIWKRISKSLQAGGLLRDGRL